MDVKEYRRLHGLGSKPTHAKQPSKRTKQSILTINTNDVFINSESNFELESPIHIHHEGRDFYVYKGLRKGISYQIHYGTTAELTEKKILRSNQVHSSFFKITKTLGLSYASKEVYKLLDSYDLHVSGQGNLTTLRWNQSKNPISDICLSHENNKDLIFNGHLISSVVLMNGQIYELYKIKEKCPYAFAITNTLDTNNRLIQDYKFGKCIPSIIEHYGRATGEQLLKLL